MDENLFKRRTKQLALHIIKAVDPLPKNRTADVLGRQLIRSGTSIGANYRAACRGKSTADVIAKLRKRDGSSPFNRQSKTCAERGRSIENLK